MATVDWMLAADQLKHERDVARAMLLACEEENKKLRNALENPPIAEMLRILVVHVDSVELKIALTEKAREIDEALGNKG